ncbi:MAG: hypothetical protein ACO1Q7_18485 [Gemmatimonas sp.]
MAPDFVSKYVVVMAAAILGAGSAVAQSCMGSPDLTEGRQTFSTSWVERDLSRGIMARYGHADRHLFGGAHLGYSGAAFNRPRGAATAADVGYAFRLGSGKTTICPTAQSTHEFGGREFDGYPLHKSYSTVSMAIGHELRVSRSLGLVPFVQVGYGYRTLRTRDRENSNRTQLRHRSAYHTGQQFAGVGLRFGELLTIRPSYVYEVPGLKNGNEATWMVTAQVLLDRR